MRAARIFVIGLLAAGAAMCRANMPGPDVIDAFRQALHAGPPAQVSRPVWTDVSAFYERRDNAPAWITDVGPSLAARIALDVLRSSAEHGLAPADYDEPQISQLFEQLGGSDADRAHRLQQLVELETRITTGLVRLGRDVAIGRASPSAIDPRWKMRRTMPDVAGSLASAHDAGLRGWLDALGPVQPQYGALRRALCDLRAQQQSGGWPAVPPGAFKRGESGARVAALQARLVASGDMAGSAGRDGSPVYDDVIAAAVRTFQEHHGLPATGLADAATVAAINVPIDARIRQVEASLDRWRWMPDDFGPRYILVNIPRYQLEVVEEAKTVLHMRVVVGKAGGHETPVFSATMTTVVLSPYWNIPDTIVAGETAPAVARDSQYLERNGIEILRMTSSGPRLVNPSDVHWNDPAELRQLAFRQKPGEQNALGHVKFLFPNEYDVYLHDTPADSLFARSNRALSHGCIRIEEPEALANYMLRGEPDWDEDRIRDAMNGGVERQVRLRQTIPVHIVYFTAFVDESGGLHLLPDVYGYDKRQIARR